MRQLQSNGRHLVLSILPPCRHQGAAWATFTVCCSGFNFLRTSETVNLYFWTHLRSCNDAQLQSHLFRSKPVKNGHKNVLKIQHWLIFIIRIPWHKNYVFLMDELKKRVKLLPREIYVDFCILQSFPNIRWISFISSTYFLEITKLKFIDVT
jgi:hypothetical protein